MWLTALFSGRVNVDLYKTISMRRIWEVRNVPSPIWTKVLTFTFNFDEVVVVRCYIS